MARQRLSAGLLMFRRTAGHLEVLLGHPGGPFWAGRDAGAWSIPKGEVDGGEDLEQAAVREFHEETGLSAMGPRIPLGDVRQRGGKVVHAWAFEGTCDPRTTRSGTFTMEWPVGSGRHATFPELDRTEFFPIVEARRRLGAAQARFLDRLLSALEMGAAPPNGNGST